MYYNSQSRQINGYKDNYSNYFSPFFNDKGKIVSIIRVKITEKCFFTR